MQAEKPIDGLWHYLRVVLLKPAWEFAATGLFFTFMFLSTWWRDNFASEEWKRRLELKGLLPDWHPAWWLCIGLLVVIFLTVRESYRQWREVRTEIASVRGELNKKKNEPLPITAPQVSLVSETAESFGPIRRFLLGNISRNEPIYNICFQPVRLSDGANVIWVGIEQQLLPASTRMPVAPILFVDDSYVQEFKGVDSVVRFLELESTRAEYDLGPLAFTCEDSVQNRYLVTFRLGITSGGTRLNVNDCERVLIGARPSREQ